MARAPGLTGATPVVFSDGYRQLNNKIAMGVSIKVGTCPFSPPGIMQSARFCVLAEGLSTYVGVTPYMGWVPKVLEVIRGYRDEGAGERQ
jgi:hypothetical protein